MPFLIWNLYGQLRSLRSLIRNLIRKKVCWVPFRQLSDLNDFPRLSMADLQQITIGVFQVKMAPSYVARLQAHRITDEMEDADLFVWYYNGDNRCENVGRLLRFKIPSRFRTGVEHQVWIHYEPFGNTALAIKAWYCHCKSGARIVGCCAHVACMLWFLGFARYVPNVRYPAQNITESLLNAGTMRYP